MSEFKGVEPFTIGTGEHSDEEHCELAKVFEDMPVRVVAHEDHVVMTGRISEEENAE